MPSRPYTERLLYLEGAGKSVTFTVPEGKRVIVTNVVSYNNATSAQDVYLQVHGIYAVRLHMPDPLGFKVVEVRLVAYERETVALLSTGPDTRAIVTGYMFDDQLGDPPWAPGASTKPVDPPRPEIGELPA